MTDRHALVELATRWTAMSNCDLDQVDSFLAPDFSIEFGATIRDPDPSLITSPGGMADFVAGWRHRHGDLRFALEGTPLVDETSGGAVAFTWCVDIPGVGTRSGIDLCHISDGKISPVWSVTGERLFPSRPADTRPAQ